MVKSITLTALFWFSAFFSFAQNKPNILFISVDDLKPMLGVYGDQEIFTPNIDKLADYGTLFNNTACQQAVCGPSRASLLTGLYPDATQVFNLSTLIRDKNPNIITLPQHFKNNGYATTGVGKTFDPRSVDDFYDILSWSIEYKQTMPIAYYSASTGKGHNGYQNPQVAIDDANYLQYLADNNITTTAAKNEAKKLFPFAKPSTESMDVPDDSYKDGARANYALEKLEELSAGATPFFLAVGFAKPHLPFVAPQKYWDLYDRTTINIHPEQGRSPDVPAMAFHNSGELVNSYSDIPMDANLSEDKQKELIHGYRASVSYVDTQIGKLLDKLDELGIAENTIIVLWGDHGWHLGDHNMWAKHSVFEQAVKSPLMIFAPNFGLANNINSTQVELIDIYPTLCDLAGLEKPDGLQGESIIALMEDPLARVREASLSQYHRTNSGLPHMGYTLRDERYRYTKWIQIDYLNGERYGPTAGTELYDYETDPHETINLASDPNYENIINSFELLFKERNIAQNTASSYLNVSICENESYASPDGNVYDTNGIYTATINNQQQQDSVITINLEILEIPDNSVIAIDNGLIASVENMTYQWINCANQEAIENETNQTYLPTESGDYAVELSNASCTVKSACINFTIAVTGITAEFMPSSFSVYPNPVMNKLAVDLQDHYKEVGVEIKTLEGKTLFSRKYYSVDSFDLDFNYPSALYIINIEADKNMMSMKVFKD